MKLENILLQKKSSILKRWFDLIVESYPAESQDFLKKKRDRFDNPVAYEFRQGIKGIYEELLHWVDFNRVSPFLEKIIKIRAIQDLSPSKAIAFIFLLKKVIREKLERDIQENGLSEDLLEFESRIDGLALLSFDVFMNRREKLYELRVKEVKNRVSGLLRMSGLTSELEKETDLKEETH
jgi:parvulin-like peptidyl-prolyl isomerase